MDLRVATICHLTLFFVYRYSIDRKNSLSNFIETSSSFESYYLKTRLTVSKNYRIGLHL